MTEATQLKVLVIDDEKPVLDSFRNFLEDQHYTVFTAADGHLGIELFDRHQPDIVLVDLRMPEVNGHQVLEQLSEKSPDTPLIVVSGTGTISDTVEALRLGAWDYLLKPVTDLSIVEHAISKSVECARLIRENRSYQNHLEEEVEQRTRQLTEKVDEMSRFNRMAVGRERRIIELKRQINSLLDELGREPKYKSPDSIEEDSSLNV